MKSFRGFHPLANLLYFIFVIAFAVIFMHPVCLAVSLIGGIVCYISLEGRRALRFLGLFMLPVFIIAALINPLINHAGVTVLYYFKSGNALTLESIVYGIASAVTVVSVIVWFACFNYIMTSDKFICLFGRIMPSVSLLITMTMRFVPNFRIQLKEVSAAQRGIGQGVSDGGIISRAKNGVHIMSVMLTRALENSVETADSMKSRGYGTGVRTSYRLYSYEMRDIAAIAAILILGSYAVTGGFFAFHYSYLPVLKKINLDFYGISVIAAYVLLIAAPAVITFFEEVRWKF